MALKLTTFIPTLLLYFIYEIDSADVTAAPTSYSVDWFKNGHNNCGEEESNETLQENEENHEEADEVYNEFKRSDFKEPLYHYYCEEPFSNGKRIQGHSCDDWLQLWQW